MVALLRGNYKVKLTVQNLSEIKTELNLRLGVSLSSELQYFDETFKDWIFLDNQSFDDIVSPCKLRVVNETSTVTASSIESAALMSSSNHFEHTEFQDLPSFEDQLETFDSTDLPEYLLCPITLEMMKDPVFAMDGHTYERDAIEDWFKTHDTSPMTNESIESKTLLPNFAMRSQILALIEEQANQMKK
eukprot:TRINITY_DN3704_c0_g1_i5.p3 TRINITY_DN3704_c0_g1~~TRINITY_DN3704_c0_g1_i5.p3  ORF type:complete len:189 (-),score=67.18 TRINITY_DN3704_c0_g1_i5:2292-2858(-)